jgi:hypothetical protein
MIRSSILLTALSCLALAAMALGVAAPVNSAKTEYKQWQRGPSSDPSYFPITVWLQDPAKAPEYKAIGINTFIALWKGPTEEQLDELRKHDMKVICDQNEVGLKHIDDPIIVGWMHGDEPDNAQSDGKGGYGPPVKPEKIIADYRKIKRKDPSRPVMLNLGQGVAWDKWHGRGVRTNHPEDYPEYMKGGDIISFDIYPVNASHPDVKNKLHLVPYGVDRLKKWGKGEKVIWNCIECTGYSSPDRRPTPHQVKAEVWMSLIHESRGLIYFVHEFTVKDKTGKVTRPFNGAGLLRDKEMAAAVGKINKQIHELAPVLNSPTVRKNGATVSSSNTEVPIDIVTKSCDGAVYVFAVGMRNGETTGTFQLGGTWGNTTVEVIGENRTIQATGGKFTDTFKAYDVHLYKISKR